LEIGNGMIVDVDDQEIIDDKAVINRAEKPGRKKLQDFTPSGQTVRRSPSYMLANALEHRRGP
jgi:hypothetical protein